MGKFRCQLLPLSSDDGKNNESLEWFRFSCEGLSFFCYNSPISQHMTSKATNLQGSTVMFKKQDPLLTKRCPWSQNSQAVQKLGGEMGLDNE